MYIFDDVANIPEEFKGSWQKVTLHISLSVQRFLPVIKHIYCATFILRMQYWDPAE